MIRKLTLSAAFALSLAGAVQAADLTPGQALGTTQDAIATALKAQGYEMNKYEQEHGLIEVKAMKDGRRWEVKIDAKTGKVVRVKADH